MHVWVCKSVSESASVWACCVCVCTSVCLCMCASVNVCVCICKCDHVHPDRYKWTQLGCWCNSSFRAMPRWRSCLINHSIKGIVRTGRVHYVYWASLAVSTQPAQHASKRGQSKRDKLNITQFLPTHCSSSRPISPPRDARYWKLYRAKFSGRRTAKTFACRHVLKGFVHTPKPPR